MSVGWEFPEIWESTYFSYVDSKVLTPSLRVLLIFIWGSGFELANLLKFIIQLPLEDRDLYS